MRMAEKVRDDLQYRTLQAHIVVSLLYALHFPIAICSVAANIFGTIRRGIS